MVTPMNRLALIKQAAEKVQFLNSDERESLRKALRNEKERSRIASMDAEQKKAHNLKKKESVQRCYLRKREKGICGKCSEKALTIAYQMNGKTLHTKPAFYCLNHWDSEEIKSLMRGKL